MIENNAQKEIPFLLFSHLSYFAAPSWASVKQAFPPSRLNIAQIHLNFMFGWASVKQAFPPSRLNKAQIHLNFMFGLASVRKSKTKNFIFPFALLSPFTNFAKRLASDEGDS